jgi:L-2-hydroxyglutarate oxidase LhgO
MREDGTECTVTIIGAGVIGLAIADALGGHCRNVVLLERHHSFGQETSSRHSGVIHAGIYYPAGLLKARFCREGNRLLYDRCIAKGIPHRRVGKLIVAVTDDDEDALSAIRTQARENGVSDLVWLSPQQIRRLEPDIHAKSALYSPSTGIIDAHGLMRSLYHDAESRGVVCVYRTTVSGITYTGRDYEVEVNDGEYRFRSQVIVNCAGLHADRIAAWAGIDIDRESYRLHYCKGNYFTASPAPRLTHLVYPVPQTHNEGLGIHATLDLGDRVRFGPDTQYVDQLEYDVDAGRLEAFYQSIKTYLPGIRREHLAVDMCGIRPKLQGPGEGYRDFVIKEESALGLPGLINLIGIESPGLTSCIPIGRHVAALVKRHM